MNTTASIIKLCGGASTVALATGLTASAIHKWVKDGIPERYWATLRGMAAISLEDLHNANEMARRAASEAA